MTYVLIGLLALVLILVIWAISSYNSLIRLRNSVEEAFSTMDVYLKKRFDLIPNLVATVKGYAAHEANTLEKTIAARNVAAASGDTKAMLDSENQITNTLRSIFALSESYPDLKANTNFLQLQTQIQNIEEDIANSRKYYNAVVKQFNTKCEIFPSSIIAGMFRFERSPMFEITDTTQRDNVKVEF